MVTRVPDMSIPSAGNLLWIIPKKYYESIGFERFAEKPVGSGPYALEMFRNADSIRYVKRSEPHAFRQAVANELNFKVISENSQILAGLRTGEIDMATDINLTGEQAVTAKNEGLNVLSKLTGIIYVALPEGSFTSRDTPLQDKRVRMAVKYALDNAGIAKNLFAGYASPAYQLAIEDRLYYDPSIPEIKHDVAKAKALLAEAGYPDGFRLPLGMDYTPAQVLQDVIVAIQGNLNAVGIQFDVISNERAVFVDKAYGRNNLPKGDIWVATQGDPIGFGGSRTFIGCGKPAGGAPTALIWCSEEWDSLMDAAYQERDSAKRGELLKKANRVQYNEAVYIPIYNNPLFILHTEKVRGFTRDAAYYNLDAAYKVK
jgi:peptide/nickel transport system substrate-binding protein